MEMTENTQEIINVLRGYGRKTLKVITIKTSLSESIVLSELKELTKNGLVGVCEKLNLVTYRLRKDKWNCRWFGHWPGDEVGFCVHPETPLDDDPCRNETTCAKHIFEFEDDPDLDYYGEKFTTPVPDLTGGKG